MKTFCLILFKSETYGKEDEVRQEDEDGFEILRTSDFNFELEFVGFV